MSGSVGMRVESRVAYVTLERPESLNALNAALIEDLAVTLQGCFDPAVRAVVLTGAGKAFCAGGDLAYLSGCASLGEALGRLISGLNRAILDIRQLGKPVLAAINGAAAGAGMSIALACDLRLMSAGAKFRQAYSSNGLIPDGGWTLLAPRLLGLAKATELLLLDPLISAQEALALGLVQEVLPGEDLMARARALAERLAQGPAAAYAEAKALLNQAMLPELATQLEQERQAMIRIGNSADAAEGLAAFLAKRAPIFSNG